MLNPDNPSIGYQLGRLFAVLENIQIAYHGGWQKKPNATIRDRSIGGACSRPASVFPQLLKTAAHHASGENTRKWADNHIGEITAKIPAFPNTLNLEQQGEFFLGYYHQRAYRKPGGNPDKAEPDLNESLFTSAEAEQPE